MHIFFCTTMLHRHDLLYNLEYLHNKYKTPYKQYIIEKMEKNVVYGIYYLRVYIHLHSGVDPNFF